MATSSGKLLRRAFLAVMLGLCALSLQANMRAPRALDFPPSSALEIPGETPDLIVSEESLSFALTPYSEDTEVNATHYGFAAVSAIYTIEVARPGKYDLSFVTPDATPARASLNDFEIPVDAPILSPKQKDSRHKTWESHFHIVLNQGRNVISVTYRQPVGAHEWNLGYFNRPKWHSDIHYELWPLKEWQLAPNFRLYINVQVADDTGWFSRLFSGSRWKVSACETRHGLPDEASCLDPVSSETPEHQLLQHYEAGPDFPDHLRIRISE